MVLLLLLMLCPKLLRCNGSFGPSACELGLKVEVVFCPDCGVNHGDERLVDDATGHHTMHFWASPGEYEHALCCIGDIGLEC